MKRIGCGVVAGVVLFVLAGMTGFMPFVEVPLHLVLGWAMHLATVLPGVEVDPGAVAGSLAAFAVLVGGGHALAGRLFPGAWRRRWTAGAAAGFVVLFGIAIAAVGLLHQAAWLATSSTPLVESSWDHPDRQMDRLCAALPEPAEDPRATARALASDAGLRRMTNTLRLALVEHPSLGHLVLGRPEDEAQYADLGFVLCVDRTGSRHPASRLESVLARGQRPTGAQGTP